MPEVDTNEVITEADQYVRDHLLIQFAMWYLDPYANDYEEEEVYNQWIKWLKEKENEHGKRS